MKGHSIEDHIMFSLKQIIRQQASKEVSKRKRTYVTFTNFEKALYKDSVEKIWESLSKRNLPRKLTKAMSEHRT